LKIETFAHDTNLAEALVAGQDVKMMCPIEQGFKPEAALEKIEREKGQ